MVPFSDDFARRLEEESMPVSARPTERQVAAAQSGLMRSSGPLSDTVNAIVTGAASDVLNTLSVPMKFLPVVGGELSHHLEQQSQAIGTALARESRFMTPEEERKTGTSPWRRRLLQTAQAGAGSVTRVGTSAASPLGYLGTLGLLSANDAWDQAPDLEGEERLFYSAANAIPEVLATWGFSYFGGGAYAGIEKLFPGKLGAPGTLKAAVDASREGTKTAVRSLSRSGIDVGKGVLGQGTEEIITESWQTATNWMRDPEYHPTVDDFRESAIIAGMAGGIAGGVGHSAKIAMDEFVSNPSRAKTKALGNIEDSLKAAGVDTSGTQGREKAARIVENARKAMDAAYRASDVEPDPEASPEAPADVPKDAGAAQRIATGRSDFILEEERTSLASPITEDGMGIEQRALAEAFITEIDNERIANGYLLESVQKDAEVIEEARGRLDADYLAERTRLLERGMNNLPLESPVDAAMAQEIITKEIREALNIGTEEAIQSTKEFVDAYRHSNTMMARTFRFLHDKGPKDSIPESESMASLMRDKLFRGPDALNEEIDGLIKKIRQYTEQGKLREAAELKKKLARRRDDLQKSIRETIGKLKDKGWNLDDLEGVFQEDIRKANELNRDVSLLTSTWNDWLYEFFASAGLLSGLSTTQVDVASNAFQTINNTFVKRLAQAMTGSMEPVLGRLSGSVRDKTQADFAEFTDVWKGIWPGLTKGLRRAVQAIKTELPQLQQEIDPLNITGKFGLERGPKIPGWPGRLVRALGYTRLLICDEITQSLVAHMEVGAQARRVWRENQVRWAEYHRDTAASAWAESVRSQGLPPDAVQAEVGGFLAENPQLSIERLSKKYAEEFPLEQFIPQEVDNMRSESWRRAMEAARKATFQEKGGPAAQLIKKAGHGLRKAPGPLATVAKYRWSLFINTPTNVLAQAARMTPGLSALNLAVDWQLAKKSGDYSRISEQTANTIISTFVVLPLISAVSMVGDPEDPDDLPLITGNDVEKWNTPGARQVPRMSIRWPGTRSWTSYEFFLQIASAIAFSVDSSRAAFSGDWSKLGGASAATLAQMSDKLHLNGLVDFVLPMADASAQLLRGGSEAAAETLAKGWGRWAADFGPMWVPNLIKQGARVSPDSPERRVWGEGSDWFKRLAVREAQKTEIPQKFGLFPDHAKYDLSGRRITRGRWPDRPTTNYLYRILAPFTTEAPAPSILDRIVTNYNQKVPEDQEKHPSMPLPYVTIDGKRYWMSDEQRARFERESGRLTISTLEGASALNIEDPLEDDMEFVTKAIGDARSAAREDIKGEIEGRLRNEEK